MTPRERVEAIMNLEIPDLIFWGGIDNNELLYRGTAQEV